MWSTGIEPVVLTKKLLYATPNEEYSKSQGHSKALVVDHFMRVKGVENVFSIGDCATIEIPSLKANASKYLGYIGNVKDAIGIDKINQTCEELTMMYPEASVHLRSYTSSLKHVNSITINEFLKSLEDIEKSMKTLPATAQVATQEGKYLGRFLNRLITHPSALKPFKYAHLGMSAYIGGHRAIVDLTRPLTTGNHFWLADRFIAFYLWRSIYFNEQVSLRTRFKVVMDWIKKFIFGRDISIF